MPFLIVFFIIFIFSPSLLGQDAPLEKALANYEKIAQKGGWPEIPAGPKIEPGLADARVAVLRERLRITGDLKKKKEVKKELDLLDRDLEDAIKIFQKRHGIVEDGLVGEGTRKALNVSVEDRISQIKVNLQRTHNLPPELGPKYIMVHIPNYRVYVVENGKTVIDMRAIVGLPSWPTPLLSTQVTSLVFNPTWHIPKNIMQKEIVGKIEKQADYLTKEGIKVYKTTETGREEVDSSTIDWNQQDVLATHHFQQPPSAYNPLGKVKFIMPNKDDIYLHDTSSRKLFGRDTRSLSHGCIRIEKPIDLVTYLLQPDPEWDEEKIQATIKRGVEKHVKIPEAVPIYIIYQTAWVDPEGLVHFRPDVYHLDKKLLSDL